MMRNISLKTKLILATWRLITNSLLIGAGVITKHQIDNADQVFSVRGQIFIKGIANQIKPLMMKKAFMTCFKSCGLILHFFLLFYSMNKLRSLFVQIGFLQIVECSDIYSIARIHQVIEGKQRKLSSCQPTKSRLIFTVKCIASLKCQRKNRQFH